MLDRALLLQQLEHASKDFADDLTKGQSNAQLWWHRIKDDADLSQRLHTKKHAVLLPAWQGPLSYCKKVAGDALDTYCVLAVDGSQIYYDKHQGPACYLLNIGSVLLQYQKIQSSVVLLSQPHLFFLSEKNKDHGSTDFINLQREEYELARAWQLSQEHLVACAGQPLLTMMDGSLIFFQCEGGDYDSKQHFLKRYLQYLENFCTQHSTIIGYLSFPRNKELVHILQVVAQEQDNAVAYDQLFGRLTDVSIAHFFLQPGYRSTLFASKAPISYVYPRMLKPYFCYVHVGYEIVRLEFPYWIAIQEDLVDRLCAIAYDQAMKGHGYPVCLFEAHEQAVVKGYDRDFFYAMLQKNTEKQAAMSYQRSYKSLKKSRPVF